eukprot:m.72422 g.72422  ORF g.72422 m.72422 type:complete len:396 (-) comp8782_c1_seq1:3137-4324(-)
MFTALVLAATSAVGTPTLKPCVCASSWADTGPDCSGSIMQKGCPTFAELQRCNMNAEQRWCQTTELSCADQYGSDVGSGIMRFCDVKSPQERAVIKGIAEGNKCMTYRVNNGTTELYDISILQKKGGPNAGNFRTNNYYSAKHGKTEEEDQEYYLNVCGGLVGYKESGTHPAGPVAAFEEQTHNESGITHVLARFGPKTNLTVVKDNDLRLNMADGDESDYHDPNCPERKVDIILMCSDADCSGNTALQSPAFIDEFKKCEYVFVWNTCAACPIGHPARTACGSDAPVATGLGHAIVASMTPSGALLVTVAVLFSVYIVVGFSYNRFVNGERGLNQVPHYEFWSSCFNNVAAGPGALSKMLIGKPKPSSISQNFHPGLLDDEDDEDELEDADSYE